MGQGRLLLFCNLVNQTNNADDNKRVSEKLTVCNHSTASSRWRRQEAPSGNGGANRLPLLAALKDQLFPVPRIPYAAKKGNQKISVSKSADVFGFDMKKTAPHRAALDNFISGGYTKHRKGAAGRRLAPVISYKK